MRGGTAGVGLGEGELAEQSESLKNEWSATPPTHTQTGEHRRHYEKGKHEEHKE